VVTLGFRDPQRLGTPGDGWGATAVRGLGATVEKETAEAWCLHHLQRDGILKPSLILTLNYPYSLPVL
jgi:hypothetical protein